MQTDTNTFNADRHIVSADNKEGVIRRGQMRPRLTVTDDNPYVTISVNPLGASMRDVEPTLYNFCQGAHLRMD